MDSLYYKGLIDSDQYKPKYQWEDDIKVFKSKAMEKILQYSTTCYLIN